MQRYCSSVCCLCRLDQYLSQETPREKWLCKRGLIQTALRQQEAAAAAAAAEKEEGEEQEEEEVEEKFPCSTHRQRMCRRHT